MFHLLGLDYRRVNYHLRGRDERLTDVDDAKILAPLIALAFCFVIWGARLCRRTSIVVSVITVFRISWLASQ